MSSRQGKLTNDGWVYNGDIGISIVPSGRGLMEYSTGAKYDGQWKNGKRHGKGKFTSSEGRIYEGNWKDGNPHGHCKLTSVDGEVLYDGNWAVGKRVDGKGFEFNPRLSGAHEVEVPPAETSPTQKSPESVRQARVSESPDVNSPELEAKPNASPLDLKKVHFVNTSVETIRALRTNDKSDFGHLLMTLRQLSEQSPERDMYLYRTVEISPDGSPGPIIVIILIKKGLLPTKTALRGKDVCHFDQAKYNWVQSSTENAYYLDSGTDFSDSELDPQELTPDLFMVTPRDLQKKSIRHLKLEFSYSDPEGNQVDVSWNEKEHGNLHEYLTAIAKDSYELDEDVEKMTINLKEVIKESISKARHKKKNDSGAYFDAVNWDRKDMNLKEISVVKVCPINQHSRVTASLPDGPISFFREHFKLEHVVSDYFCLKNGCFSPIPSLVLHQKFSSATLSIFKDINNESEPSLRVILLGMALLANMLFATKAENDFGKVIGRFSAERIYQFFGHDEGKPSPAFMAFLKDVLFPHVGRAIQKIGSANGTNAFILDGLFYAAEKPKSVRNQLKPTHLRLGKSIENPLEIKYKNRQDFEFTDVQHLRCFQSDEGITRLIMQLLENKDDFEAPFGVGSRVSKRKCSNDLVDTKRAKVVVNSLSECLRSLPLPPDEKDRLLKMLKEYGEHEMNIRMVNALLEKWVRTLHISSVRYEEDPMSHIMTVKEGFWLIIFYPTGSTSGCKHSVLLDANNDTIMDPVDDGHGTVFPRSLETMSRLRIGEVDELRMIQQVPLTQTRKDFLNKVPFFTSRCMKFL